MRWLRGLRKEDGATIVLMAVTLVALIALVGLAIDAGAIFAERRQLSRGADAAVLAVAEDCAVDAKPCNEPTAYNTSEEYVDVNADDGGSTVDDLELDLSEQTIWVSNESFDPDDGTDQFKLYFMRVLGFDSTRVAAEAKAQWGVAIGGSAIPVIISHCEWEKYGFGTAEYGTIQTLTFHDGNSTEDCNAQAGQDADGDGKLPGGFGWLETYGDCIAEVHNDNWVAEEPGASPPNGCSAAEFEALLLNKDVVIPLFDDEDGIEGGGSNGEYRIESLAAFHITAYDFRGQYRAPAAFTCPGGANDRCIQGYFTDNLVLYEGDLGVGADDYGVYIVKLIG